MELCHEIDIRLSSDKDSCSITALRVLPDDRLIMIDTSNKNIKLFDNTYAICASLKVHGGQPFDIALFAGTKFVVTMLQKPELRFGEVIGNKLKLGKGIKTDVEYVFVAHCAGQLIATGLQNTRILDLTGITLATLDTGNVTPYYIAVNETERVFYALHPITMRVTCMTLAGTIMGVYKNKIGQPHGLTVHPDGSVYVCDSTSNNIRHITSQCTHIETILDKGEIKMPQTVACNANGDVLYVSEWTKVKVYKIGL